MNQIQRKNCAEKIEGYLVPRPGESSEAAFSRAKRETIIAYQNFIENLYELSFDNFLAVYPNRKDKSE